MPSRSNSKPIKWIVVFGGIAVLVIVYALFNPAETPWFPKCPLRMLTGLECPGCGSQRAVHHLLHFDIRAAMAENILLVIAIPYLVVGFAFDVGRPTGETALKWRKRLFGTKAIMVVFVAIMLFWVLRNVPFFSSYL